MIVFGMFADWCPHCPKQKQVFLEHSSKYDCKFVMIVDHGGSRSYVDLGSQAELHPVDIKGHEMMLIDGAYRQIPTPAQFPSVECRLYDANITWDNNDLGAWLAKMCTEKKPSDAELYL